MADYLKLFMAKRLTPSEAHHLEYIKGRLAALKVEDPEAYKEFSEHYGVEVDVEVKFPEPAKASAASKKKKTVKK